MLRLRPETVRGTWFLRTGLVIPVLGGSYFLLKGFPSNWLKKAWYGSIAVLCGFGVSDAVMYFSAGSLALPTTLSTEYFASNSLAELKDSSQLFGRSPI